jgi:hypothetical protein
MALQRGTYNRADTQRLADERDPGGLQERAAGTLIDGLAQADAELRPHVVGALTRLTGLEHKTVEAWRAWKSRHADPAK